MRRWLRFTIRGLLMLVLAIAVVMAIWSSQARKDRLARQTVRTFGGSYGTETFLSAPDWMVKLLGDEYFFRVQGIAIASGAFRDNDLAPLEGLHGLRGLTLTNTHVTDAGLKRLAGLGNLTTLELKLTDVTDDGMQYLKAYSQLEDLNLIDTEITDKGLSSLPYFPKLYRLWIGKSNIQGEKEQPVSDITDAGLSAIERQSNLKRLVLYNAKITPEGIARLKSALPGLNVQISVTSRPNRRGDRFIESQQRWVPENDAN
jgi:hypothetical protein